MVGVKCPSRRVTERSSPLQNNTTNLISFCLCGEFYANRLEWFSAALIETGEYLIKLKSDYLNSNYHALHYHYKQVAKHKHEWLCGGGTHFHKGHYH